MDEKDDEVSGLSPVAPPIVIYCFFFSIAVSIECLKFSHQNTGEWRAMEKDTLPAQQLLVHLDIAAGLTIVKPDVVKNNS
ncbi:MAG: hypothetical protein LBH14_03150 [Desulfobulbaceae bacterium]|jgi:hypothetical protein|nr:hypothetical protein [Desulfobulbaceae bacterium]